MKGKIEGRELHVHEEACELSAADVYVVLVCACVYCDLDIVNANEVNIVTLNREEVHMRICRGDFLCIAPNAGQMLLYEDETAGGKPL